MIVYVFVKTNLMSLLSGLMRLLASTDWMMMMMMISLVCPGPGAGGVEISIDRNIISINLVTFYPALSRIGMILQQEVKKG